MTRLLTYIKNAAIILLFLLVLFSALISLYDDRERFIAKFQSIFFTPDVNESGAVNSLITSSRQIPPDNILDLNINDDANTMGQWSAPIDWNVTAIHAVLLPNSNVMTFGSYAIEEKENTDIRANKTITLTNGLELQRDVGSSQWVDHAVNSGVDFDIWDVNQGYGDSAHQVFIKPVLMDAWCSIVRVIDSDRMLILGGNMNHLESNPDTQNSTMIYNVKERKFEMSKSLNYKR